MADLHLFEVAVPCPLRQTFTYSYAEPLPVGSRVRVPFGKRHLIGLITAHRELTQGVEGKDAAEEGFAVKAILELIDAEPLFSPVMLKLAQWMSAYYFHPIGEVVRAMLPAASQSRKDEVYELSPKGKQALEGEALTGELQLLAYLFARQERLKKAALKQRLKAFCHSHPELPGEQASQWLKQSISQKLVRQQASKLQKARKTQPEASLAQEDRAASLLTAETPRQLTAVQKQAYEGLLEKIHKCKPQPPLPFLLWGVTGAGKTEIYLQLIAHTQQAASGSQGAKAAQALVLVPEIALTPQMTAVFSRRFPGQVAVVHSAMTDSQRWQQWEACRLGQARILIGARSAVFAPFANLQLIIVDEEHDGSYKQNAAFSYHGRDIAVLRAKWEAVPILLGSATPSLESLANARLGRYHLIELQQRVSGASLPRVQLVKEAPAAAGFHLSNASGGILPLPQADGIAQEVISTLEETVAQGQQAIVLINRRGYSYYLLDSLSKEVVGCPACSISLTLHKKGLELHCHCCGYRTDFATIRRQKPEARYLAMGFGSQKAEEALRAQLPAARIARLDSDIAASRDRLMATLEQFRQGQIDILVGTQMLAKGHDFPNVSLTVLLNVDQMLHLPDFRAGERTFQLLVQAAGRAGRGKLAGKVLIQTLKEEQAVIAAAINHDYQGFAARELEFRQCHGYPPFGKLILWVLASEHLDRLKHFGELWEASLERLCRQAPERFQGVKIQGPNVPAIEKLVHRYRRFILFSSLSPQQLHQLVRYVLANMPALPSGVRLQIDVDPQSLL